MCHILSLQRSDCLSISLHTSQFRFGGLGDGVCVEASIGVFCTHTVFREFFVSFCHVVVGRLVSATLSFVVCGLGWGGVCVEASVGVFCTHTEFFS